jgi:hypothetical protein
MSNTTINNAALDIIGNLTGVNANVTVVSATGQINALGNVVASRFVGNGSLLTGVTATVTSGPKFSMYLSNTQTIFSNSSSVGANIRYDGIVFDTHSACNVTTGSFTVPQSGYYQIISSVAFPNIDLSGIFDIRLVKNTTQQITTLFNPIFPGGSNPINSRTTYNARALVNFTAGDVINVRAYNQLGLVSFNIFGNSSMFTTFSGYYVGA